MEATARQIEKLRNTARHSAEHPTCVYAANSKMRLKAKLEAKGFNAQAVIDEFES